MGARVGFAALVLPIFAGCSGAPSDLGLEAWLRVSGASYREGSMPTETTGPEVASVDLSTSRVEQGQVGKPLHGALGKQATGVAFALAEDTGYWLLPAGLPDVQVPDYPTFDVALSFASNVPEGPRELVVRAIDASDRFGAPRALPLMVKARGIPDGPLVVSLAWDRDADLDLHVVDPNGVEIMKTNPNSYEAPPPGQPIDPTAWQQGASLDVDSNANCVRDGRRLENVVWSASPPTGHYLVRVDTFSLCGEGFANWEASVRVNGVRTKVATGQSGPTDEAMPHDRGAGVVAVEFDIP